MRLTTGLEVFLCIAGHLFLGLGLTLVFGLPGIVMICGIAMIYMTIIIQPHEDEEDEKSEERLPT